MTPPESPHAELSTDRQELLALLAADDKQPPNCLQIEPCDRDRPLPLSFVQERMWVSERLAQGQLNNATTSCVRARGELDIDVFRRATNEIIQRHEIFRTRFVDDGDGPSPRIADHLTVDVPLVDLRSVPADQREIELRRQVKAEVGRPFDLSTLPLVRNAVFQIADDEFVFAFAAHHITFDGWSGRIFVDELAALYEAFAQGLPSPLQDVRIQYVDYAAWQREWVRHPEVQDHLAYWERQLGGGLAQLELPPDRPRPETRTFTGAAHRFEIPATVSQRIGQLARDEGVTPFMILLAAYDALLHRCTGQDEIVVGSPVANRQHNATSKLIGCFMHPLVLRVDLAGNPSFRELLGRVRHVCLSAYAHQEAPFELVARALHPHVELGRLPLFQTLFNVQQSGTAEVHLPGLTFSVQQPDTDTATLDLSMNLWFGGDQAWGVLEYSTELFDAATIKWLERCFQSALDCIVTNPDCLLSEIPISAQANAAQGRRQGTELSVERRAVLDLLLAEEGQLTAPAPVAHSPERGDLHPTSFGQERLWFFDRLHPGNALFSQSQASRLDGPLDVAVLVAALNEIVRRHEVLRTRFEDVNGRTMQRIVSTLQLDVPVVDLSHLAGDAQHAEVQRITADLAREPFDLSTPPLFRVKLVRLAATQHLMLLTVHHIISDGWSLAVFRKELAALYRAFLAGRPSPLRELPLQYADYAIQQRQWYREAVLDGQLAYWKQHLGGTLPVLELPTDRPRPAGFSLRRKHRVTFQVPTALGERLAELSRQAGTTLFMTLLSAFQTLLYRLTAQTDVIVDSPIAGRNRSDLEGLIGFFVNSLALRTDLSNQPSFLELLQRVRKVCLDAYSHQDLPFDRVVADLQPNRYRDGRPLTPASFMLHDTITDGMELSKGLQLTPLEANMNDEFDLTLIMWRGSDLLTGTLQYDPAQFDCGTIERLTGQFVSLLATIVADPEQRISELSLMPDAERQQLLVDWNRQATASKSESCVQHLFEAQAAQTPDAIAACMQSQATRTSAPAALTYSELNCRANQLAHYLRFLGAGPETRVAICLDRSLDMLAVMLGVLKSGAAYIPLDPAYPRERLELMLRDAQPTVLVATRPLAAMLPPHKARIVCLDDDHDVIVRQADTNPTCDVRPEHPAYLIYTSGSSGTPKGVAVTHRGVVNHNRSVAKHFALTSADRVLQFHSISFDAAVEEIFPTWSVGATLVVRGTELIAPGDELAEVIRTDHLTVLNLPTAYWHEWVVQAVQDDAPPPPPLRLVVVGGDQARPESYAAWLNLTAGRVRWLNTYGPTETTIISTLDDPSELNWENGVPNEQSAGVQPQPSKLAMGDREVAHIGALTIGRPLDNTSVYVLDAHGNPVPIGVPGELCVGGAGLARGYHQRPDLTAERFIPDPFTRLPGERIYRTGDRVRWRSDGRLEFLGRFDQQLKIRGFRIEPGEIEAVLTQHPAVSQALVVARQDDTRQDKYLAAYIVASDTGDGDNIHATAEFHQYLQETLPGYMVPSAIVLLERLPLSPNGKVDRKALPTPDLRSLIDDSAYVAPRSKLEQQIADVWSGLLGVDRVGIHDNFFALGGDSISIIRAVARIRELGISLSPQQMFQHQTVAEIAALPPAEEVARTDQGAVTGPVPLTPVQRWFFAQSLPAPDHYNQSVVLSVKRALDPTLLVQAADHLLEHHDALRMRFVTSGDGVHQRHDDVLADSAQDVVHVCDLSERADTELAEAIEALSAEWQASLNLERGPLVRLVLFDTGGRHDRLLFLIHHLVVDGVSWRILLDDLLVSYEQLLAGHPIQLPAKTTSFQEWAERLSEYANQPDVVEQRRYWLDVAASRPAPLPCDHDQGGNTFASADTVRVHLDASQTELMQEFAAESGAQVDELLLTALTQAVTSWTGDDAILLTLEGHGREPLFADVDLSRTIGWFTTLFPVCLSRVNSVDPPAALKSIQRQLGGIPQHGLGYGLLRYLGRNEDHGLGLGDDVREVSFNYLGKLDQTLPDDALFALTPEVSPAAVSPLGQRAHLLDVNCLILDGCLQLGWTFSRNLHRRETIEQVAHVFLHELRKLIAGTSPPQQPTARLSESLAPKKVARQSEPQRSQHVGSIQRVERHDALPLSFAQQRLWFLDQLAPDSVLYNGQVAVRLRGTLDVPALSRSFQEIVRRHEVLRTHFPSPQDEPVQAIAPPGEVPLLVHDLSALPPAEREQEARRLADEDANRPFDLARGPLVRIQLVQLSDADHVLIVCTHHIVVDAWSMGVLVRDLAAIYAAYSSEQASPLPDLPIQFADFTVWQRDWLQGEVLDRQVGYWKQQLAQLPTLDVPTDFPRPPSDQTFVPAETSLQLDAELSAALRRLSQHEGGTLFMTLFAAFNVLLGRYSGQHDLVVGTPIAGRNRPELEDLIGFFVNTLVLRTDLSGDPRFRELLSRVRETAVAAYEHQDLPFEKLVEILRPARDPARTPLFQVFFNMLNLDQQSIEFPGLTIEPFVAPVFDPKFDLNLDVQESRQHINLRLGYNAELFTVDTIRRLGENFRSLLQGIVADPDTPISALPCVCSDERDQILSHWNATATDVPDDAFVHRLFEAQADLTPDAIAALFPLSPQDAAVDMASNDGTWQTLTYSELNGRANQLARHLQSLNVGAETVVGIRVERSLEMIVGVLGILKAGAAYLPLDPTYPADRLQFMLEDADVPVLVTQGRIPPSGAEGPELKVVRLDADWDSIAQHATSNIHAPVAVTSTAYLIYTSGSTGKPKGVTVPHGAFTNFLLSMRTEPGMHADDVLLAVTTLGFDIAGLEIFLPLIVGARLVVVPHEVAADGSRLAGLLKQSRATVMQATPATWRLLLETDEASRWDFRVLCGGEQMPRELADRLLERSETVWNLYGPTETTVWSTAQRVQPGSAPISIGRPIDNTSIYVLDPQLHPLPVGVPGDLYIGGAGVTRGYMGRPALSAERFIPDPFTAVPGARLYVTGDIARWRPDGTLEYLGRSDHQVKLRGFRIELGEIEAVLGEHASVKQVVVVPREDVSQDQRLVAYVVTHNGAPIPVAEFRSLAEQTLPHYMAPSAYLFLDTLPLTPNGKVDRKSLPMPEGERQVEDVFVAPRNELEQQIAGVWRDVLRLDKVGIRDNFFDLGGHSLLVVQVHRKLKALFGPDLSMMDLFQFPSIEALAKHLGGAGGERAFAGEAQRRIQDAQATNVAAHAVAIIGMAGRLPGAANVASFWENLSSGEESITFFTDEELAAAGVPRETLANPRYVKAKGYLADTDMFDAAFFHFSPHDAEFLDPQQRLFLECSWEALETAGYDPQSYDGLIGMYAGSSMNSYMLSYLAHHAGRADLMASMANFVYGDKDHLATRTSYLLDLHGPSVTVQTACSTSLVAIHQACRSLLDRDCDLAMAGGVSVTVPTKTGYMYQPESIGSPDGHCRTFDARAEGTLVGNGAGVVVLKRLDEAIADGDEIYAVIRGTAINNDGSQKVGYTAPSIDGQAAVIALAQARAGVEPSSIRYIEAHGTGTLLGDPIEVRALTRVFREQSQQNQHCALGSVKTNFGHLDAAAGVAGLMKTALALKHRKIPPSLNFEEPNPEIDFADSPFFVNTELRDWDADGATPRRAGVSSFGIGGTNAHAILEEAPEPPPSTPAQPWQLLPLSAKSPAALDEATTNLANFLEQHPQANLADVAFTLQVGRSQFPHRQAVVASDAQDAIATLRGASPNWKQSHFSEARDTEVVFLFPGQSAQHPNMARELYEREAIVRTAIDHCCQTLESELNLDLRTVIFPDIDDTQAAERLTRTSLAQPAIFVIEYALAQLWSSWGVRPAACVGHSIGEYVAACLAGVFDVDDALRLVATRGRLMDRMPPGSMLAVPLSEADVQPWLSKDIALAAVNGPSLCVLAGPVEHIDRLDAQLQAKGIQPIRLHASHAFHSAMMDPILDEFGRYVAGFELREPTVPYVSNVTGTWIEPSEPVDPQYWVDHLRRTVRFSESLDQLLADPTRSVLEVGPGRTLSSLAQMHPACGVERIVTASLRHPHEDHADAACLLRAAGRLWMAGAPVNWRAVHGDSSRRRIPLPTYPFQRQSYWFDLASDRQGKGATPRIEGKIADVAQWLYTPGWKTLPPVTPVVVDEVNETGTRFLVFLDSKGVGALLSSRLVGLGHDVVTVDKGRAFRRTGDRSFVINPDMADDYAAIWQTMAADAGVPQTVVHLWSLTDDAETPDDLAAFDDAQRLGMYSLLHMARALSAHAQPTRVAVIANNSQSVLAGDVLCPEKSTLESACLVIPQEMPGVTTTYCDVCLPPPESTELPWLTEHLSFELAAPEPERVVAYRGRQRWAPLWERLNPAENAGAAPRIRQGGVYLITGGLGGVGFVLAERLASIGDVKLIMVGRSELPPEPEWSTWLDNHDADDPISLRLKRAQALQARGANVEYFAADVADESRMQQVMEEIDAREGRLNGVIYAAGKLGHETFQLIGDLDAAKCADQFRAKVHGLMVLDRILGDRPLDFCVLTSSLSAVLGGLGYCAYAAANRYMDAFVAWRNAHRRQAWTSVNWDAWNLTGEPVDTSDGGLASFAITPAEGVQAFESILGLPQLSPVIVSTGDLDARLDQWVRKNRRRSSDAFVDQPTGSRHARPSLRNEFVAPQTPNEKLLAQVWCALFRFDEVGTQDDFFELGGHSLLALQMLERVRAETGANLSLAILFDHRTIESLAALMDANASADTSAPDGTAGIPAALVIPPLVPAPRGNEIPLSFAQEGAWFIRQLQPDAPFNIAIPLRLRGTLEFDSLQASVTEIVRRHESLRTTFDAVGGRPFQVIHEPAEVPLPVIDLTGISAPELVGELQSRVVEQVQTQFDLQQGPLFQMPVLRLADDDHVLLFVVNHVAFDGWSTRLFAQELSALYDAHKLNRDVSLAPLPVQYADYAVWQRDLLRGEFYDQQLGYWTDQLADCPPELHLTTDRPAGDALFRGDVVSRSMPKELGAALRTLANQEGVTLFMLLLAAYKTLLMRYVGQEDLVVGTPIANRNQEEMADVIGFCVNLLPLRTNLTGNPSFRELMRRERDVCLSGYSHQELPFGKLVQELDPARGVGHSPFFQVQFALHEGAAQTLQMDGLELVPLFEEDDRAHGLIGLMAQAQPATDHLFLNIVDDATELAAVMHYRSDLFDAESIRRMMGHMQLLLESVVVNPDHEIWDLPLMTSDQRQRLLEDWSVERQAYPPGRCIGQLIADQAALSPDAVAVIGWESDSEGSSETRLTYAELNRRANRLAHHLRAANINSEDCVAVCLSRSTELMVAVLGVWKAGASLVMLDHSHGPDRLRFMLHDSQAAALLTRSDLVVDLVDVAVRRVDLDAAQDDIDKLPPSEPEISLDDRQLAYLVYTSGSTGQPKGVMVTHRSLVNAYRAWEDAYALHETHCHLQMANATFDVFFGDVARALCAGATLVLCPRERLLMPAELDNLLREYKVDCAEFVPAVVRLLLDHLAKTGRRLDDMKLLICGSDTWTAAEYQRLRGVVGPSARVVNSYGVAEATIDSSYFEDVKSTLTEERTIPIGRPFAGSELYVLDRRLEPTPVGVPGELYLGGAGLARGYLNRPDLTGERFVPHPFSDVPGGRLYRTGDRARFLPDGQLEFIGRVDQQIKIRGFRIEPGEVEAVLAEHPGVQQAVVLAREERPGDKQLVGYAVAHDPAPTVAELRQFMLGKLPDYMVPTAFVLLDAFPLTASGKLNRRALPAPDSQRVSSTEFAPPETAIQQQIAAAWTEVLRVDKVGIYDNFFDLGGHSLLLVELHAKLRDILGDEISIVDLFRYPTVDALAIQWSERASAESGIDAIRDRAEKQRAAMAQRRRRQQRTRIPPPSNTDHDLS